MSNAPSYKAYHSPDTDDLLLFWQLSHHKPGRGLTFESSALDTEALNLAALAGEPDICAVSAAILPQLAGRYLLSPYGASIGRGFGPVVVSTRVSAIADLNNMRIAIPGLTTTAALVFRQLAEKSELVTVPISPFETVFEKLTKGEVDAAVLIHEGQLAYRSRGFCRITDVGAWWFMETGLPLPLGVNVVRAFSDAAESALLNRALQESVEYGLNNAPQLLHQIIEERPELKTKLPASEDFGRYLSMYANEDSRRLDDDCMQALNILLGKQIAVIH